jgi:hypothetical protein
MMWGWALMATGTKTLVVITTINYQGRVVDIQMRILRVKHMHPDGTHMTTARRTHNKIIDTQDLLRTHRLIVLLGHGKAMDFLQDRHLAMWVGQVR